MCPELPLPPSPCIIRWCTWLKAAIFYCDHFESARRVLDKFDSNDAISIDQAKILFASTTIKANLAYIKLNFSSLIAAITKLESQGLELKENISIVINVKNTLAGLNRKEFFQKFESVFKRNKGFQDILEIHDVLNNGQLPKSQYVNDLTPAEITFFKFCPVTSADVERSFSKYTNLLTSKRTSFTFDNLKNHFIIYCNQEIK